VSTPGITFQLLDGSQAAGHADELSAVHREVYGEDGDGALLAGRFTVRWRQPGFVLAEARNGGYLVGYAAGLPLRPATSWWKNLTTALPPEDITEHPGRTFAVTDLLVRPSWRRQGIAGSLYELIMSGRPEERATVAVPPTAAPAQAAFRQWGWRKVARSRGARPGPPVLDVLLTDLSAQRH
jgi:GNAT superfamily N-acetyltransferase